MSWLTEKKGQPKNEIARISDSFVDERNTHPGNLVALAVQRNDPIENIKQLMDLQERWEANEARKAYAIAMNAFKANPPAIFKDKHVRYENRDGSVTEYDHASLGHVVSAISEGLGKEGLSHRWDQEQLDGGQIRVTCIITHAMGHSVSNFLQSSADQSGGKNNIQAIGSTVTYLQRYTLLSAVGLATQDMDDDGRGAETPRSAPQDTAQPEPEQTFLPAYPDRTFEANFPSWPGLIKSGKHTHDSIINKIESAYTLSAEQKTKIKGIK